MKTCPKCGYIEPKKLAWHCLKCNAYFYLTEGEDTNKSILCPNCTGTMKGVLQVEEFDD